MESSKAKFMFYLQLGNKLSDKFFYLAVELKKWGIELIPVQLREVDEVMGKGVPFFVILTDDLFKMKKFQTIQSGFLNFVLRSKKARIIHLNSFGHKSEYNRFRRQDYYVPVQLPMHIKEIGEILSLAYLKANGEKNIWPGGRRAKLPAESLGGDS